MAYITTKQNHFLKAMKIGANKQQIVTMEHMVKRMSAVSQGTDDSIFILVTADLATLVNIKKVFAALQSTPDIRIMVILRKKTDGKNKQIREAYAKMGGDDGFKSPLRFIDEDIDAIKNVLSEFETPSAEDHESALDLIQKQPADTEYGKTIEDTPDFLDPSAYGLTPVVETPADLVGAHVRNIMETERAEITSDKTAPTETIDAINAARTPADVAEILSRTNNASILASLAKESKKVQLYSEALDMFANRFTSILEQQTSWDKKSDQIDALRLEHSALINNTGMVLGRALNDIIDTSMAKVQEIAQQKSEPLVQAMTIVSQASTRPVDIASLFDTVGNDLSKITLLASELVDFCDAAFHAGSKSGADFALLASNPINNPTVTERASIEIGADTAKIVSDMFDAPSDAINEVQKIISRINAMADSIKSVSNKGTISVAMASRACSKFMSLRVEEKVISDNKQKRRTVVVAGSEYSGTTIIPYLIATSRKRRGYATLIIDTTGYSKHGDYDIPVMTVPVINQALSNRSVASDINIVVTKPNIEIDVVNSLITRAASEFETIFVVTTPESVSGKYKGIVENSLALYIITDARSSSLRACYDMLHTKYDNTAIRVIYNKTRSVTREILQASGVTGRTDLIGVSAVNHFEAIEGAALGGMDPCEVYDIRLTFDTVADNLVV